MKLRLMASLGLAMIFFPEPCLIAQTTIAPAAPIPAQILSAKKVFISNASTVFNTSLWSGATDRTYNEFYAAVKNWGRYELVQNPSDADIVFEVSLTMPQSIPYVKVRVLDPKSGIVLWIVVEDFSTIGMKGTRDKKFTSGIDNVVNDLKALASGPPVASQ